MRPLMAVHLIDSELFRGAWSTPEVRDLFDDRARLQRWLDVMAALALEQAELGLIPRAAAEEIARKARVELLDLDAIRRGIEESSHSLLSTIRALQAVCEGDAGEYINYGTTVHDITDTANALAFREVCQIVYRDLRAIEGECLRLARAHRDTIMPGRTHGQSGLPITFGFKAAVWAREARRHIQRLRELAPRLLIGQLAGAVGTLAFFEGKGLELQRRVMRRLGLGVPDIAWDTARDNLAEFAGFLAMTAQTCAKIGTEVYNLQRPEIGELAEPFQYGRVGSVTMPHKRNPETVEHIATLAKIVRADAAVLLEGMIHEHERDGRPWKAEWVALPEACVLATKALQLTREVLAGLVVHPAAMRRNLHAENGLLASEAVMGALAKKVGKQTAHTLVYEAAMRAAEQGINLREALLESPAAPYLVDTDLDALFDLRNSLGHTTDFVDQVLLLAEQERAADPATIEG
ncbi:MAG: fumarate lyase [Chloroflexota bacterium]